MIRLVMQAPAVQPALGDEPFDTWRAQGGKSSAEFRRRAGHYLVRFPDQCDFLVDVATGEALCTPVSDDMAQAAQSLFHNAIEPLVGNFLGGLYLHGSAVAVTPDCAAAFLGDSRRGKTTLAGGFARAGHPFLTEDTVTLALDGTCYRVQSSRPVLRLFPDSARHLLGEERADPDLAGKSALDASDHLPFAAHPATLRAIYLLGPGESEGVTFERLSPQAALAELLRHSFILDVEDRARLRGHFRRIGGLADTVPCYRLDYPRVYEQLVDVVNKVAAHASGERV